MPGGAFSRLLSVLAVFMIVCMPVAAQAAIVTIDGVQFDTASSTNITNPYVVNSGIKNFGPFNIYQLDVETVNGVPCLKFCLNSASQRYGWFAQDTSGNVHYLKFVDNGVFFESGINMMLPDMLVPADPTTTTSWASTSRGESSVVTSTNSSIGSWTGCIEIQVTTASGSNYHYRKNGQGVVGFANNSGTYPRTTDVSGQAGYKPAVLPGSGWPYGAYVSSHSGGYNLVHDTGIVDHDGIDSNGGSHVVYVEYPDGSKWNIPFHGLENSGSYSYGEFYTGDWWIMPIQSGVYTYHAMDKAGNVSVAQTDNLSNTTPLPVVNSTTINIAANGTSPTVSWTAAGGAAFHRIRIIDSGGNVILRHRTDQTSIRIPPGILSPNTSYSLRVEAYGEPYQTVMSRRSASDFVTFATGSETQQPFVWINYWDRGANTWTDPYFGTTLNLAIEVFDHQGVPGNIKSVTATLPNGTIIPLMFDYSTSSTSAYYNGEYYQSPPSGVYTFTVEDQDGNTFYTQQSFTPNPIASVSGASVSPTHDTQISGDSFTASWTGVSGAAFYQVKIRDEEGNYLYGFSTPGGTTSLMVPSALLEKDRLYKLRVDAYSNYAVPNFENGSSSHTSTLSNHIRRDYVAGSSAPTIDLDRAGTVFGQTHHPTGTGIWYEGFHWVRVSDADGVPGNIKEVYVIYPDSTVKKLFFGGYESSTAGYYELYEGNAGGIAYPSGTYTYIVVDKEGNTASVSDYFIYNPLPGLPQALEPLSGATTSLSYTKFDWTEVAGAYSYNVRLKDSWGGSYFYYSPRLSGPPHVIPSDKLTDGGFYRSRISAYREDSSVEDIDNHSVDQWFWGAMNYFWVSSAAAVPGSTASTSIPAGETVSDYAIYSQTVVSTQTIGEALGVSSADDTMFMVGRWNPSSGDYDQGDDFLGQVLTPGQAFWALFREGGSAAFSGSPVTPTTCPCTGQSAYGVSLEPDWNQVGNPFNHAVSVGRIYVEDSSGTCYALTDSGNTFTQQTFWVWDGSNEWQAASSLAGMTGGFLKNLTSGQITVWFPADAGLSSDMMAGADLGSRDRSLGGGLKGDRKPAGLRIDYRRAYADVERPPSPPGSLSDSASGSGGGGGGGGGGGCFLASAQPESTRPPVWILILPVLGLALTRLIRPGRRRRK